MLAGLEVEPQISRSETEETARKVMKVEEGVAMSRTFHDANLIITDFAKGIDFDARRFKFQVR